MFSPSHMKIVEYISEEVRRQQRGPEQVYWMLEAWQQAQYDRTHLGSRVPIGVLSSWGMLVERYSNRKGFRTGELVEPPGTAMAIEIHSKLSDLLYGIHEMPAADAYYQFEKIHPFNDGNGRIGKILYNYLLNSLDVPTWPPNFFGDVENP